MSESEQKRQAAIVHRLPPQTLKDPSETQETGGTTTHNNPTGKLS